MKYIFVFLFTFSTVIAFSQKGSKDVTNFPKEYNTKLQTELSISFDKAEIVLSIISQSNNKMTAISKNKTLSKEQKLNQFKSIAVERDAQIAQVLSPGQVKKLQEFMIRQKQLAESKQ